MLNLTGRVFGKLTVLNKSSSRSEDGRVLWECKCSCGRFISTRTNRLTSGAAKSCGCARYENGFAPKQKERVWYRKESGWTQERFTNSLVEQNNACAICRETFVRTPNADHEHVEPPKPRGLLCTSCNIAIGLLKDRAELVEEAAKYIRKYK
jgi:hypothetical protein